MKQWFKVIRFFLDQLAGLPETVNSIFKVLEYLRVQHIYFAWYLLYFWIGKKDEGKKHFFIFRPLVWLKTYLKQS